MGGGGMKKKKFFPFCPFLSVLVLVHVTVRTRPKVKSLPYTEFFCWTERFGGNPEFSDKQSYTRVTPKLMDIVQSVYILNVIFCPHSY